MLDEKEQEKPQEEEESYSFLQETIKPKKISRKMLIQQFVRIALYGLIFGGVASLGFFAVKPAAQRWLCLLYTSPSPRDGLLSRMPSSA